MNTINITDTRKVTAIIKKAAEVYNIPLSALLSKSRKKDLNLARMCIANIARDEHNIHFKAIAEALKRDRSSIYYYVKKHKDLYQNWTDYRKRFHKLYENLYRGEEKNILDRMKFRNILKDNDITQTRSGIVTILVSSGNMTHTFKTTYANMCENVEAIKKVFTDYEVKIDIQL